jgi:hypothetical protein
MTQRLRFMTAGALAGVAGLLLSGALSVSAQPLRLTTHVQSTTAEVPSLAVPKMSTAISGTLQFFEVYTYSMVPYGSDSHVTADFDRDGRTDIVIAETLRPTHTSRLVRLRNLGNWQFAATVLITYPTAGSYLYEVQAADFNQDQWPDLVLRNHCEIDVLLNDQQGSFITSWTKVDVFRYCGKALTPGDLNGDKAIDIVAGEQSGLGGIVDVFLNNGSGTFFMHTWQSPPLGDPNAGTFHDIVLGDLNHDALPDIAASEIYNGLLTTFLNGGMGLTFTLATAQNVGEPAYAMTGGNLNGDDLVDVILNTGGVLRAFTAQGNGVLSETWTNSEVGSGFAQALADFDRDSYDDLFASSFSTGQMYVYLNHPVSGTFQLVWSDQLAGAIYSGSAADAEAVSVPSRPTSRAAILRTTPPPGLIEAMDLMARAAGSMSAR